MLKYLTIPVTPFQQNCSLVWDDDSKQAAVIDPGGDTDVILDAVKQLGLKLEQIWITHAHVDHALRVERQAVRSGGDLAVHRPRGSRARDDFEGQVSLPEPDQRLPERGVLVREAAHLVVELPLLEKLLGPEYLGAGSAFARGLKEHGPAGFRVPHAPPVRQAGAPPDDVRASGRVRLAVDVEPIVAVDVVEACVDLVLRQLDAQAELTQGFRRDDELVHGVAWGRRLRAGLRVPRSRVAE